MTSYTTIQGDMLDGVAYKVLGSEKYVGELMAANPGELGRYVYSSGTVLAVPEIETPKADTLPPWKKEASA